MTSSPLVPGKQSRLKSLDALRGLAAVYVMFAHYTSHIFLLYPELPRPAFHVSNPNIGVRLFFILSGFVIFMSLERTKTAAEFVRGRFLRLYPTYWAALIVTFTVVSIFGLRNRQTTFEQAMVNLTMIQTMLGVPAVDASYWTLGVEWCFYALATFLLATKLLSKSFGIVLGLLAWSVLSFHLLKNYQHNLPVQFMQSLLNATSITWFGCGISIYNWNRLRQKKYLALLLISIACIFLTEGMKGLVLGVALSTVVFLSSEGKLDFLAVRPLVFLGSISYCLYLVHQNLGFVVIKEIVKRGGNINLAVVVAVAISFALAIALSFGIERPCIELNKRLRAARKEPNLVSVSS